MIQGTKNNFQTEVLSFDDKVIVDFWAPWCGPCQMLTPVMEELSATVKVVKVNVDEEPELSSQYNVSSIPTVIIFNKGQIVDTIIGFRQKEDYLNAVNKA